MIVAAAAPLPTIEEAGADPGLRCSGGPPPPTGGVGDSGAAAGVSLPGGGSTHLGDPRRPGDFRRSDDKPLKIINVD